jgi:RNA polymerase sigma factor for flagellar operon FliA
VEGEALFLSSLPVIDDITGQVCRRHHFTAAEADDFRSDVRLHFIDREYGALRRFEGRSSLPTYVNVVVQRLALDFRNRQWGKWRPSAEAKRLGPTAMLFERLITRDGWSIEQAAETMRVNHGVVLDDALRSLCEKLGQRGPSRQIVAEEEAHEVPSNAPGPDANVVRAEQGFLAKRVRTALDRARQALGPEERLILKMRFEDAVPVADIARALHLNQKRLYRTIEQLLARLRQGLEAEGLDRGDVSALFADGAFAEVDVVGAQPRAGAAGAPQPAEPARTPWLKS